MSFEQVLVVLIVALPLAGFLTTAMVGRRLGLNAFWIPVGAVVASWVIAMVVIATFHANILGSDTGLAGHALAVDPGRRVHRRLRVLRRQPDRRAPGRGDDDRHARARLLDRLHAARPRPLALLRLPEPVHGLDAHPRAGGQLAGAVPGLGAGRPVELPAHRLLVPQADRRRGEQEGIHHEPRRRRRLRPRDHGDLRQHAHHEHPRLHRVTHRTNSDDRSVRDRDAICPPSP